MLGQKIGFEKDSKSGDLIKQSKICVMHQRERPKPSFLLGIISAFSVKFWGQIEKHGYFWRDNHAAQRYESCAILTI
jgi:hypothetical protein